MPISTCFEPSASKVVELPVERRDDKRNRDRSRISTNRIKNHTNPYIASAHHHRGQDGIQLRRLVLFRISILVLMLAIIIKILFISICYCKLND